MLPLAGRADAQETTPDSTPPAEVALLVRRQLVQLKLQDPENAAIRNDVLQKKMHATVEASDNFV